MSKGSEALARLLEQLDGAATRIQAGEDPQTVADAIWGDFRAAVAGAMAELRESEAEGVRRWQDARHGKQ